ncbi:LIM domain-binding protein 3, variant 2 [Homalodisca vitripennis]|nr:LIM domain-binding protein 3, variant 2 [Homalodisca vitripennis]
MDQSKRMSVCSNEVCALSEKKSAIKAMASLSENPNRASPIPFSKGEVVKEDFSSAAQEAYRKSENVNTSDEGNVQITRKTKVEETFVKSQKMYSAEISSSSQASVQVRAESPEMEQIMAKRRIYQSYQDSSRLTPNTLQQRAVQSERCLTPEIEHLMDKPHGSWSPMPAACFVRPISPKQIISYPPDIPPIPTAMPQPRTATPEQFQEARETVERFVDHTKQVHQTQTTSTGRSNQSTIYTVQQFSDQQYTPRYDSNHGFSAYVGRGNAGNGSYGNGINHRNGNPGNPNNQYSGNPHNPGNHSDNGNHGKNGNPGVGSGNPRSNDNGNQNEEEKPAHDKEEKPTVTEPDDSEEKHSRKSSKTDQSQKSSRKASASEEESSRRVFSDFGGPQMTSSVEVESTTEGGVQKTSVTKSEKMAYSSCEFESTRKSSIKQEGDNAALSTEGNGEENPNEPRKYSYPKFSMGESSINDETVTKSQVEEIIKQELNKVFQMAHTMEKTNFGEMYDQKFQEKSSSRQTLEQTPVQVVQQTASQKSEHQSSSAKYDNRISYSGEVIKTTGKLTSGLTIAPERPFTPQALESNYPLPYQGLPSDFPPPRGHPEPPPSKPAYVPVMGGRDSPLLQALTYASDRPYSPLPTATSVETPSFITSSQSKKSSMLEALTTAPKSPFHIQGVKTETKVDVQKTSEAKYESVQKYAPKPSQSEFKPISVSTAEPKSQTSYINKSETSGNVTIKSFPPVTDELKSAFKSSSKTASSSFSESERQQTATSKQTLTSHTATSKVERPITPSGLHPPNLLPYYQQNIGEIPLAHRSNSPVPHQIKAPSVTPPRAQSVPRQGERRGSVKAMSEAYSQQLAAINNQQQSVSGTSSISYVSSGAYSSGSVSKAYSYEQEHKSIDALGYHASPLAGKIPLAGERTLPKCSSPILGKLDHTKQVFKPSVPAQQPVNVFRSPTAEQANLRQAPPYFIQDKEKAQVPWVVMKEQDDQQSVNAGSIKPPQPPSTRTAPQTTVKPSLPTFPSVNKTTPAFPNPPKPYSLPGVTKPPSAIPDAGPGGAPKGGTTAGTSAPRRGRGVLNTAVPTGGRIPLCGSCNNHIRGPFITALGKIWCPEHFVCVNAQCRRPLQDIGFVEDDQGLYCEFCFEQYLAPTCSKCNAKVKGDCLNAIGKHFHPECFTCAYCGKLFGNSPFFLEDALPYCEADWNELFTTKCFSCGFPIEAGDRWVEALNNNYHSQCFNCTMCKKNLEGQSFFAKGGRPFCKNHAR